MLNADTIARREKLMTLALVGLIVEHDQTPAAERFKAYLRVPSKRPRWEETVGLAVHDVTDPAGKTTDWQEVLELADTILYDLFGECRHEDTLAATAHLVAELLERDVMLPETGEIGECLALSRQVAAEFPETPASCRLKRRLREFCQRASLFLREES